MKLICFPHAGGFAFYFNFLRQIKTLHKGDLYLYEYPGRGYQGKEPNAESLMAIAQTAAARIADFVGDEPFCIFGHSMGAFVAYETEVLLEADYGKQAARLILSGQHPPVCFRGRGPPTCWRSEFLPAPTFICANRKQIFCITSSRP